MKNKFASYLIAVLAIALTVAYIGTAWYLSAVWSTLVPNHTDIPRLSAFLIRPLPLSLAFGMLHWQLLAIFSLVVNCIWGFGRVKCSTTIEAIALPFLIHVSWLLLCLMLHVTGLLASFVTVAYIIK